MSARKEGMWKGRGNGREKGRTKCVEGRRGKTCLVEGIFEFVLRGRVPFDGWKEGRKAEI